MCHKPLLLKALSPPQPSSHPIIPLLESPWEFLPIMGLSLMFWHLWGWGEGSVPWQGAGAMGVSRTGGYGGRGQLVT